MVATLIGKGGENIRSLQDELGGLKLSVSTFAEMPDDVQVMSEEPFEVQDRRSRQSKSWENPKKGGRQTKGRRR